LSLALRLSDILKAAYSSWFVYDFLNFFQAGINQGFPFNALCLREIYNLADIWCAPTGKMDNAVKLQSETPEVTEEAENFSRRRLK
jgi:hypothetical protein